MTLGQSEPLKIRVAFPTPYVDRAEFVIALNPLRHTEGQLATCLTQGWLYEHCTSWVMTGLLRDGDIAVDVGAHVGYYTLLMRTLVGQSGQVFAAEPMPASHAALMENVLLNAYSNVHCAQLAISDKVGEACLVIDRLNEGESRLASSVPGRDEDVVIVRSSTLDEWLSRLSRAPRLIKLDAEGCEAAIVRGGASLFRDLPPDAVVCEINPPALERFGADQFSLRRSFSEMGYGCYLINVAQDGPYDLCQGAILRPYGLDEAVRVNVVHNLLFVRPGVVPLGLGV